VESQQRSYHLLLDMEQGSREAFDRFYQLHIDYVLNIAFQILKEQLTAEDVCHDVFLEIFKNPKKYNPKRGSVKAWLAVKTKSRSIDFLRKKKPLLLDRFEAIMLAYEKDQPAEVVALSQIERDIILAALRYLPEEQRDVIYGAYFEEKTQRELADLLDRPLGTIKSQVRYGLKNLRKQNTLAKWIHSSDGGDQ